MDDKAEAEITELNVYSKYIVDVGYKSRAVGI